MVGAISVHHRDAFRASVSESALRDVGDTRVENAGRAGERRKGKAGAFVRRPPPVAGAHHEAFAGELAALVDVIDVAADGQAAVGP